MWYYSLFKYYFYISLRKNTQFMKFISPTLSNLTLRPLDFSGGSQTPVCFSQRILDTPNGLFKAHFSWMSVKAQISPPCPPCVRRVTAYKYFPTKNLPFIFNSLKCYIFLSELKSLKKQKIVFDISFDNFASIFFSSHFKVQYILS